jgi:hypothetical protein
MKQIERHRGTVVILAALAAALVADGLIVGFLIKPPPLGWVGFAIVAALVLGLGMLAPLAFEHARQRAAARRGDHPAEDALCDTILVRLTMPSFTLSSPCAFPAFTS